MCSSSVVMTPSWFTSYRLKTHCSFSRRLPLRSRDSPITNSWKLEASLQSLFRSFIRPFFPSILPSTDFSMPIFSDLVCDMHSFTYSFIYSTSPFIHLLIHPFIHLSIHPPIHSSIHPCNHHQSGSECLPRSLSFHCDPDQKC